MKVQKSENIDKLATALCKFQGEICGVKKNAKGYGYDYTNLEAILKAIQEPLNNNGLSVVQFPINSEEGGLGVFTQLQHTSGQYIASEFTSRITDKPDVGKNCQAHGSLITYYRRYALQSVLNLASADDDGQAAKDTFKQGKRDYLPGGVLVEEKPDYLKLAKQALFSDIKRKGLTEEEACKLMKIKNYTVLKNEKHPLEIKAYHNLIKAS